MSIDAGVCLIKQPDRSAGKRTRMSAGIFMPKRKGGDPDMVAVTAVLTGTAPFAGSPGMVPGVSEPTLAMCLRAAAWFVSSPLKDYLPKRQARDFLPFLQPRSCRLTHRRKIVKRVFREESAGISAKGDKKKRGRRIAAEPARAVELRVLTDWTLTAEIAIALFPGVNEANIRELFVKAGERIGLGMYRPQQGGDLGTFELTELRIVSGVWPAPLPPAAEKEAVAEAAAEVAETVAQELAASGDYEDKGVGDPFSDEAAEDDLDGL